MENMEQVDSTSDTEQQPLNAVTHVRVKFVDDGAIMWVPVGDVRDFIRIPPSHAEDFDGGKIYRVAWTNPVTKVTQILGATIADLALGERHRLWKDMKRPHFQTVRPCALDAYYKELNRSSSDQPSASSEDEAMEMDTCGEEAAGDDFSDDGMNENAQVAGPDESTSAATGKTSRVRGRKLVKRISRSRSNATVVKRMSKEAYILGASAQTAPRQSPQQSAPTLGAHQRVANSDAVVEVQSSLANGHQNASGGAGTRELLPSGSHPPAILENDDPPTPRDQQGDGLGDEGNPSRAGLPHEDGLPAPGVNGNIEEAQQGNGPGPQNVPSLGAGGLVRLAEQQNLQLLGRLVPNLPVPDQVAQHNRNNADGGALNRDVVGGVAEHQEQPVQVIPAVLPPHPPERVQEVQQDQNDAEDADMDEDLQPYRVQIPLAGFIDPPPGLQKYDTLDEGRQTYLGHNRVVPTTSWAFHRNRPKWIFVADSAVMLCGEHVLVNSAVDPGRTTVNLPGRSPRKRLPVPVHRHLRELLGDYIDARQPLWEHKHSLMMKMNRCLGEKIKSVRKRLFPGLVRADSTRADRNRRGE